MRFICDLIRVCIRFDWLFDFEWTDQSDQIRILKSDFNFNERTEICTIVHITDPASILHRLQICTIVQILMFSQNC
jgi:hypothetical protein